MLSSIGLADDLNDVSAIIVGDVVDLREYMCTLI